jgi:hypothetical protein
MYRFSEEKNCFQLEILEEPIARFFPRFTKQSVQNVWNTKIKKIKNEVLNQAEGKNEPKYKIRKLIITKMLGKVETSLEGQVPYPDERPH